MATIADAPGPQTPPPLAPGGLYPAGFNPYAAPSDQRGTGTFSQGLRDFGNNVLGGVAAPFTNALADPRAYLFPQNPEEQATAQQNAIGMFGFTRAGSGGLADVHVPSQALAGAKAGAKAAGEELIQQSLKVPPPMAEGASSPLFLPGELKNFATEEGGAARIPAGREVPAADRFVSRQVPGNPSAFEVLDTATGKATSTVHPTPEQATAQANRLNVRPPTGISQAPVVAPTVESASAAFDAAAGNNSLDNAIKNAAKAIPQPLQSAVRKAIRGDGIESLAPDVQTQLEIAARKALADAKVPITSESMAAISDELLNNAHTTNAITRGLGRTPTVAEKNAQAVTDAITAPPEVHPLDEVPSADVGGTPPPQGPQINRPGLTAGEPSPRIPGVPPGPNVGDVLQEIAGIPRAALVLGHLGLLRQMLPGMVYAAVTKPGLIPQTLGTMVRAAISDPSAVTAMRSGMYGALDARGLAKTVYLNNPTGKIGAMEETMLGHLFTNRSVTAAGGAVAGFQTADPNATLQEKLERAVVGAGAGAVAGPRVVGGLNQAFGMSINALRTGIALGLADHYAAIGMADKVTGKLSGQAAEKVGHFANILTGRGDLIEKLASKAGPDAKEASAALQDAASGIFFGPRLMTSTWQLATDTIAAMHGIVPDAIKAAITKTPLDPTRLATIKAVAAFVAFGTGVMKLAQAGGLPIGTDPSRSDWGTITLPDGAKIDLWGSYRTGARAVAQEAIYANQVATNTVPKGPFAKTGATIIGDYLRSRYNPPAGVANDYISGSTALGQPPSLDPLNPLSNPPFGVATAKYAFGQGNAKTPPGPGGLLGAGETALTSLGAGVQPPTILKKRDGLGREDDGALPATPVTDAWAKVQAANPSGNMANLAAPDRNIGSGQGKIVLDDTEADRLRVLVGNARTALLSQVVASPAFQAADPAKQEKLLTGAKIAADNQGQVAFALEHAAQAPDDLSRARAARIGIMSSTTNGAKMDFIAQMSKQGSLTPAVSAAVDDLRTQPDPLKANYEPSVGEFLKGYGLVQQYLAAPAFTIGTPQDWADAVKKGDTLAAVHATLVREAAQKNTTVQQLPDFNAYIKDWSTARTSSGRPVSAYITQSGTVNQGMVSTQRQAIQKDPLFVSHFETVAKSRDPYSLKATTQ